MYYIHNKENKMSEIAKFIYQETGSLLLNKQQTAKLINKSVAYIDKSIHHNRLEKIPNYKKTPSIVFTVQDVADFIENGGQQVA